MSATDCKHLDTCKSPLCPIEERNLHQIWYPNEDVCRNRYYQRLHWIKKQKLIAKKHGSADRYFTVEMLSNILRVRKGIEGADPNIKEKAATPQGIGFKSRKPVISKLRENHTTPKGSKHRVGHNNGKK